MPESRRGWLMVRWPSRQRRVGVVNGCRRRRSVRAAVRGEAVRGDFVRCGGGGNSIACRKRFAGGNFGCRPGKWKLSANTRANKSRFKSPASGAKSPYWSDRFGHEGDEPAAALASANALCCRRQMRTRTCGAWPICWIRCAVIWRASNPNLIRYCTRRRRRAIPRTPNCWRAWSDYRSECVYGRGTTRAYAPPSGFIARAGSCGPCGLPANRQMVRARVPPASGGRPFGTVWTAAACRHDLAIRFVGSFGSCSARCLSGRCSSLP